MPGLIRLTCADCACCSVQIATASAYMGAMTIEEKAAILGAMDPRDAAAIMGERPVWVLGCRQHAMLNVSGEADLQFDAGGTGLRVGQMAAKHDC